MPTGHGSVDLPQNVGLLSLKRKCWQGHKSKKRKRYCEHFGKGGNKQTNMFLSEQVIIKSLSNGSVNDRGIAIKRDRAGEK